ncbi:hypothetical protein O6H91_11G010500 [Diphasiastrum complanatum]|uniref:Uncharacterized protein n=2 Tax=Diphasiastrum complanatum TaxID=34168 RepID=A0ACC2C690_DIPCM|nr:hypothetical protein O6H91_11G010300 [Diphasiastrum complanatum]KAJ7537543.1 hypothetical protein O6H91_11G010500 [Diphasiastrum complanatum]
MALAMEIGWRASDMGSAVMTKKRSWGDDQQKLFDLMTGASYSDNTRHTLDLFGSSSTREQSEFVELDPEIPLPSGWEKRLDLKSGAIYFVNWNTGTSTHVDPRKPLQSADPSVSHEFLSSKQSEMLQQKNLVSSLERQEDSQPLEVQHDVVKLRQKTGLEDENLELNLNLSISDQRDSSVCTMEKVQQALARTEMLGALQASTSFVSATAASSERLPWVLPSTASPATSTSSSSSSSALSSKRAKRKAIERKAVKPSEAKNESIDKGSNVILTGCKQCFMYVMLSASDPKCPRCGSTVILDFPLSLTRKSKVELNL